jgi:hypothetical protein
MNRNHKNHWESITGLKQAKRMKCLLKLNRDQLRWVVNYLQDIVTWKDTFSNGVDRWPNLWTVPRRRWISHTCLMWLWGHSLFKISSPGPVFYGTKWLLRRTHKQSCTFHLKCRIDKGFFKKRGSTIDHWRSQCKGWIIMAHSLCFHSFIHSFIHSYCSV